MFVLVRVTVLQCVDAVSMAMHRRAHQWLCTVTASIDTSSISLSQTGPAASMPLLLLLVRNCNSCSIGVQWLQCYILYRLPFH